MVGSGGQDEVEANGFGLPVGEVTAEGIGGPVPSRRGGNDLDFEFGSGLWVVGGPGTNQDGSFH